MHAIRVFVLAEISSAIACDSYVHSKKPKRFRISAHLGLALAAPCALTACRVVSLRLGFERAPKPLEGAKWRALEAVPSNQSKWTELQLIYER